MTPWTCSVTWRLRCCNTSLVYRHEMGEYGAIYGDKYANVITLSDGTTRVVTSPHDTAATWERIRQQIEQSIVDCPPESCDVEGQPLWNCLSTVNGHDECRTWSGNAEDPECANCVQRRAHGWNSVWQF